MAQQFEVAAGKLDACEEGYERNYKYIDSFDTMEEALAAYATCRGYHFTEIMYIDAKGNRHDITPR